MDDVDRQACRLPGAGWLMAASGIAYRLIDGSAAAALEEDYLALLSEVSGQVDVRRLRVRRRQPGFVLGEARHGGYLAGYAAGMPLRPSTSWWREVTTPLPQQLTAEHPGRTFALTELAVRASWRRQGIGTALNDLVLDGRPEDRATTAVAPEAAAAQAALRAWGWRKAGRTRGPSSGPPVLDILVVDLPLARNGGMRAGRVRSG